jgi:predicted RNA-binding protein YlxR (DUF448 family)
VGCGRVAPKVELVRIAVARDCAARPGRAVPDREGTMPGRGAYLCRGTDAVTPAEACLARAMRRGGIARALRSPVTFDHKPLESMSR